jgi:two-component system response regulator (stage 0 sporulation protein F)
MANIVIIDGQPCVRKLISRELIHDGHQVESFADAESVMRHLRSSRPDLVLLEPYMHDSDGWELLRHIKKDDPDLPVLIVTACKSFLDDPRSYMAEGCLAKSFDLSSLKQKIACLLRGKPSAQLKLQSNRHFNKFSVLHLNWLDST